MPERRSLHLAVPDSHHEHTTGWLLATHCPFHFFGLDSGGTKPFTR